MNFSTHTKAFFTHAAYGVCLLLVLASCKKNDLKQVEEMAKVKEKPIEVSTGIEMIYSDSAKVKTKLTAPMMKRYLDQEDPRVEMPKGVYVEFYDAFGKVNSRLRADYGIRFINKGLTKVTGDVEVVNIKGDTLNSEELWWDEAKEKVYSQKFVKVKSKDEIILAEGFESNLDFTKYIFYKIKGIIAVKQ